MKCSNCGYENADHAKFCAECGTRLQDPAGNEEKTDTAILNEEAGGMTEEADRLTEQASQITGDAPAEEGEILEPVEDEEDWYYVDSGKSVGPFRRSVFKDMVRKGDLKPSVYVWTKGMKEWTHLDQTQLASLIPAAAEPVVLDTVKEPAVQLDAAMLEKEEPVKTKSTVQPEEPARQEPEDAQWYYIKNSQTYGPYDQNVMVDYVKSGIINGNTYVWKDGMEDWAFLKNTELAAWMSQARSFGQNDNQYGGSYQSNSQPRPSYSTLQPHSVILYIILSVCTCGIFWICWIYMLARDLNILAAERGRPGGCDPVISVVLTLLSCGIFQVYFFWKEGTLAASLSRNGYVTNNAGILAVLGFFLPLASCAILQDQLNTLITSD